MGSLQTEGISRQNWAYYTTKLSTLWNLLEAKVICRQNWAYYTTKLSTPWIYNNRGYMQTKLGILYFKIKHTMDSLQAEDICRQN